MAGSDAELVTRALSGDDKAREAIADAYRERILRYITTMVGDTNAADDLTQECFRRAFAKLSDLRKPDRLAPWLYAIAVNLCRAHLKKEITRGSERELKADPVGARSSVLSSIVRRESAEALAVAIDRLPILLREAFVLHLVEGLPYAEISGITGASVETLHVRTHRAKALLRRQLGSVVDTFWAEASST
jgi:RNA polymerase sigma-70 factor, ECF subfamily